MAQIRSEDVLPSEPRTGAVRAGSVPCPLCGAAVEWSCLGGTGSVNCSGGRMVSRRLSVDEVACAWTGTRCYRVADLTVWIDMPMPMGTFQAVAQP